MLQSVKHLINYDIQAQDGALGHVYDYYVDNVRWTVRYMVVSTGRWLPGHKVLLSPEAIVGVDSMDRTIALDLTKDQIKRSPDVGSDLPVSKQQEEKLRSYYAWPAYWAVGFDPVLAAYTPTDADVQAAVSSPHPQSQSDHHLRSARELIGYQLKAVDGEMGHVDDLIVDLEDWQVHYMVIRTGSWMSGKQVLIALEWVQDISWDDHQVTVDVTQDQVKDSPVFDPHAPVNREYEVRLYDYYGRPCPWVMAESKG